ncbi:hypothetical protein [Qipengyuania sp. ASV99]|uniref:hypothetical protein n=1 Tax=Qipengyuania sp. ASV99 TaxID=3399681 RepID=UPI003A4C5122
MIKIMSRMMVTAAAASMAFAPIAAQANTRAGDSAPVYTSTASAPGLARSAEGEELRGTPGILIALLAAAAAIAGIVAVADTNDEGQSPGT